MVLSRWKARSRSKFSRIQGLPASAINDASLILRAINASNQSKVAEQLGIDASTLSRMKNDKKSNDLIDIELLSGLLSAIGLKVVNANDVYCSPEVAEATRVAEGMVKAEGLKEGKITRTGTTATQNKTLQGAKALTSFAQNADIPKSNPHKSQVSNSSNMTASNVIIHQSFTTDMTINGAREPIESANAVKRQQ